MIEVANLTREFPGVVAVNDISFSVERGEIVGFLGPNGAGKTTAMRILTCYLSPTRGTVKVAGFDVLRESARVRAKVGYLPESNPLYREMRVEEYLHFRAGIKRVGRRDRVKRVNEVVDRCGLKERKRSIIGTLSKGLKQRVGLADSIVHEPEIVILDEPTQGLDPNQVREVRRIIKDLGERSTVLLSTHILSEVERVCGRVIIINRGKLVATGAPSEIAGRITRTSRVRIEVQGDGPAMKAEIEGLPGVGNVVWNSKEGMHTFLVEPKDAKDLRSDIFRLASGKGWDLFEIGYDRVSLEDAFAELTTEPAAGGEGSGG